MSKRYLDFCSTPVLPKKLRKPSTSVSTVETNSSSSTKETSENVIQRIVKRKKETKSKIQKRKAKQRPKKKSDSDWETYVCNETSPNSDNDVLFKDIGSPERVREAPRLVEERSESPILGFGIRLVGSPGRITFAEKDPFSSKELPSVNVPWDDIDDNEQGPSLRKENVVRTYPGIRDKKRPKRPITIDKTKRWLIDVAVPTTSSDLLWDNFIKNNENVRKYLASRPKSKRKWFKTKSNVSERGSVTIEYNDFDLHIPKNMSVVCGRWDKSLQKWIRTGNEYDFLGEEDVETKGLQLNQFLEKCRTEKLRINKLNSLSSQDSTAKYSNETSTRKRSMGCVESTNLKRKNIMMTEIPDLELERINKIRKFTSRLTAKANISNKMSLNQTTASTATSSASILNKVNEQDTDVTVTVGKRQTITTKIKPMIKSIELLNTVKYNKIKQSWEIM